MMQDFACRRSAFWVAIAIALTACSETPSVGPARAPVNAAHSLAAMSSCGASFRMIARDDDSLMAPYGIMTTTDTVDVCETWTGSDYQYQALAVGSSDNLPDFVDSVQSVSYNAGNVTGYAPSGSESAPASAVGATAFDFLYADAATRQASYDYPYYGVGSPDQSACLQAPCPNMSVVATSTSSEASDTLRRYAKHGLTRRGVRALVENAEEISASVEGYRRFRSVRGRETIILSVDPRSQLVMTEESRGPSDTMVTKHLWKRVAGGHVRHRSESEIVEVIDGKRIRNKSAVTFQRVRITDPRFPPLIDAEVSP